MLPDSKVFIIDLAWEGEEFISTELYMIGNKTVLSQSDDFKGAGTLTREDLFRIRLHL